MVKKRKETVHIYIEGGGDQALLQSKLRHGFGEFFKKLKLGASPAVHAGGGRGHTFDKFRIAVGQGKKCLLLVDSEDFVDEKCQSAWQHFKSRKEDEHWEKPGGSTDDAAHMMVCCMESWFLADRKTLKKFFGNDFKEQKLPAGNALEAIPKDKVFDGLKQACKSCKKNGKNGCYDKGTHSFTLIGKIKPTKVEDASPWAKKFFDKLRKVCKS